MYAKREKYQEIHIMLFDQNESLWIEHCWIYNNFIYPHYYKQTWWLKGIPVRTDPFVVCGGAVGKNMKECLLFSHNKLSYNFGEVDVFQHSDKYEMGCPLINIQSVPVPE